MTLNPLCGVLSLGKLTAQVLITLPYSFILTGNQLIHVIVLAKLPIKRREAGHEDAVLLRVRELLSAGVMSNHNVWGKNICNFHDKDVNYCGKSGCN